MSSDGHSGPSFDFCTGDSQYLDKKRCHMLPRQSLDSDPHDRWAIRTGCRQNGVEVGIQSKDLTISIKLRHANQACVCQGGGKIGVAMHQVLDGRHFFC